MKHVHYESCKMRYLSLNFCFPILIYTVLLIIPLLLPLSGSAETYRGACSDYNDNRDEIVIGFNFKKHYEIDPVFTPFLSENQRVYVVSKSGYLHCFDKDKNLLWKKSGVDISAPPPSFDAEGNVCFLSSKGDIFYLNTCGKTIGHHSPTGGKLSHPIIDHSGEVSFVSEFGKVYYMDSDGHVSHGETLFGPLDDTQAFPLRDPVGNLYWILIKNGNQGVCFDPNRYDYFGGFSCLEKDLLILDSIAINEHKEIFFVTNSNCVNCIDKNGNVYWSYESPSTITSPLAIDTEGIIYFGCQDEKLYCLNPAIKDAWNHSGKGSINCVPQVGLDGKVFFVGDNKYVFWTKSFMGFWD